MARRMDGWRYELKELALCLVVGLAVVLAWHVAMYVGEARLAGKLCQQAGYAEAVYQDRQWQCVEAGRLAPLGMGAKEER